ncbi:hypothetical protein HK103_001801 [Boothiomyces macroporosus]|uniref:HMG box domain-containing protein n=1 Tax=Boothiomyces macroporosus TaxID=261099 RepID=A0AAD5UAF6_9FUNG|nr:hypothetical protein HK103_001801 [Boothiomyces macroporosus]
MGKKQVVNAKKEAGNARKEASANAKNAKAQAAKAAQEDEDWKKGSKSNAKKEDEEQKKAEAARKKAEREAILKAEEAELSKKKPTTKEKLIPTKTFKIRETVEKDDSYGASGIDSALDLLDLTVKDGSNVKLDRHPERRQKAAYAAFEERRLPELKAENPSLRLTQLKELLFKEWQKSPDNPMNQAHLEYDTKKSDAKEFISTAREAELERFRNK